MTQRRIDATMRVSIFYDSDHTDRNGAVEEFMRAMMDAGDTGVFDRQLIEFEYQVPDVYSDLLVPAEDDEP